MILVYHAIRFQKSNEDIEISLKTFFMHMLSLGKHNVVDLADYTDPESQVVITFDDAYKSMLKVAFPILKFLKYKFTVFICDKFLKSKNPLYISLEDIRELKKSRLCRIGYHSKNHLNMQECTDLNTIQDELKCPAYVCDPPCFAWPFWRYNALAMHFVMQEYFCARSGNGFAENTKFSLDSIKMTESVLLRKGKLRRTDDE